MRLFLSLAWRNLWRHRRRTVIVILAIAMSLALMIFYDGFVAGFEDAIYANAVKVLGGNIQVHAPGYSAKADQAPLLPVENDSAILAAAEKVPNVVAASRRIITGGMATNREGAFPVQIVGIEPGLELPVSLVAQNVSQGRFLEDGERDAVFIGEGLAKAMGVTAGDRITVVGRAAGEQMRRHTLTIAGTYDVGLADIEKRTVYMSLAEAQYLYGLEGKATEVSISLERLGQEPRVISDLTPALPGYEISEWKTNFTELKAALQTKNSVMDIFSVIILLIAGIGILNLLLMAVFERTREIGLLAALGLKPRQITTLFLLEGAMMGVIGLIAGIALGVGMNMLLGKVGFDFSAYASLTEYTALLSGRVYPTLGMNKIPERSIVVLIIAILASVYPALQAARSEPAEALHYV